LEKEGGLRMGQETPCLQRYEHNGISGLVLHLPGKLFQQGHEENYVVARHFLFSNTLNLFSSYSVREKVSHPHKKQIKLQFYVSIFKLLYRRCEDKRL
jgi:hypothetical protein